MNIIFVIKYYGCNDYAADTILYVQQVPVSAATIWNCIRSGVVWCGAYILSFPIKTADKKLTGCQSWLCNTKTDNGK